MAFESSLRLESMKPQLKPSLASTEPKKSVLIGSLEHELEVLKAKREPLEQEVIQLTSAILEVQEKLFALYQQRKS